MKRCQNIPQLVGVFRVYAAWVVLFKEPFQSLFTFLACWLFPALAGWPRTPSYQASAYRTRAQIAI
jgi:hypothetical protein